MGLVIAVMGSVMLAGTIGFGIPGFLIAGLSGGLVLFAMIESFGKISGGHFNPAVTTAMIVSKDIDVKTGIFYMIAQIIGGIVAAGLVLVMFTDIFGTGAGLSFEILSDTPDNIAFLAISEFLCVFMLVSVIYCLVRSGSQKVSLAVGATVGGMIMCTASTFFANPAVDIARILSNGGDQISIVTAVVFIVAALIAAVVAAFVLSWLYPKQEAA